MKVELEIEDLETLVFATSVIKSIEGLMRSRKEDPFVKPHLEYTKAVDAATLAMNSARRATAPTAISWDGALSEKEIKLLEQFESIPVFEISADFRLKKSEVDSLAAKGCIRIGTLVNGAIWPGESKPDLRPNAGGWAIAITNRGLDKLGQLLVVGNNEAKS